MPFSDRIIPFMMTMIMMIMMIGAIFAIWGVSMQSNVGDVEAAFHSVSSTPTTGETAKRTATRPPAARP